MKVIIKEKWKENVFIWVIIIFSSVSAFIIPIIKFNYLFIARDWTIYNSFSYFTKSCWLHYKTLPLHNPYLFGGFDILANPQSKVFSPLTIFDLVFSAPYASLFSLITLSIIGGYGLFRVLIFLEIGKKTALISVILFTHASWFSLHFAEGHIVFGSFQLMPLIFYFTLNIYKKRSKIYLGALLAFMLLDGGIYAFVYSLVLIIFSFLFKVNRLSLIILFKNVLSQKWHSLFAIFIFIGLAGAKLVPLLMVYRNRAPVLENIQLDLRSVLNAFFNPHQHVNLEIDNASYLDYGLRFHEIGSYLGVLSFFIVVVFLLKNYQKKYLPYLIMFGFFFWIGSGLGSSFNPWKLFQKLPIINNAHVQTRALFLVYLIFIILLSFALDFFSNYLRKRMYSIIVLFLLLEVLVVSNVAYFELYNNYDKGNFGSLSSSSIFNGLIKHTTIEKTEEFPSAGREWGNDFQIFSQRNTASKSYMDNALTRGNIKSVEEDTYKGEVYFISGEGEVELLSYTPNGIKARVKTNGECEIQFNTNYLLNWNCSNNTIETYGKDGLLTIKTPGINDVVFLKYRPKYLTVVIPLYLLALFSFIVFLFKQKKANFI